MFSLYLSIHIHLSLLSGGPSISHDFHIVLLLGCNFVTANHFIMLGLELFAQHLKQSRACSTIFFFFIICSLHKPESLLA